MDNLFLSTISIKLPNQLYQTLNPFLINPITNSASKKCPILDFTNQTKTKSDFVLNKLPHVTDYPLSISCPPEGINI